MDGDAWGIDLVQALAVPLTILIALIIFHRPIGQLIRTIGSRVSKIGFGSFHLELTVAQEIEVPWTTLNGQLDFRSNTTADVFDSYADSLRRNLEETTNLDYVVVDLGDGKAWMTTRLFIFAILLQQQRGLRTIVFLDPESGAQPNFLGMASPHAVRRLLATQYPYLEKALANATVKSFFMSTNEPYAKDGRLQSNLATNIAERFLDEVQVRHDADAPEGSTADSIAVPQGANAAEWIPIDPPAPFKPFKEHATWLTATNVRRDWHKLLSHASIKESTTKDIDRQQQVRAILRFQSDEFVAVLSEGLFAHLADRARILEHLSREASRPSDE